MRGSSFFHVGGGREERAPPTSYPRLGTLKILSEKEKRWNEDVQTIEADSGTHLFWAPKKRKRESFYRRENREPSKRGLSGLSGQSQKRKSPVNRNTEKEAMQHGEMSQLCSWNTQRKSQLCVKEAIHPPGLHKTTQTPTKETARCKSWRYAKKDGEHLVS